MSAALRKESPYLLLRRLAMSTKAAAAPLPRLKDERATSWRGLGIQLGGLRFATNVGEAVEVMMMPRLTPVPWVKNWVLGLANVRGRLLPVFDSHRLMALAPTRPRAQWRVVMVQDGERAYGLTVEQSFGLQYFARDARVDETSALGQAAQFVDGAYRHDGRVWYVLGLRKLVGDPDFLNVAV